MNYLPAAKLKCGSQIINEFYGSKEKPTIILYVRRNLYNIKFFKFILRFCPCASLIILLGLVIRYTDIFFPQYQHLGTSFLIKNISAKSFQWFVRFVYLFYFYYLLNVIAGVSLNYMELHSPGMGDRTFCHMYTAFPLVSLPQSLQPPNMEYQ